MQNMKRTSKKKIPKTIFIQNFMVAFLLVIVICLCVAVTLVGEQQGRTIYTSYDDNLIQIDNSSDLEVQANIFEERYIAMLISSNSSNTLMLNANVVFQDSRGNEISNQKNNTILLHKGRTVLLFEIPSLDGKNAGNIQVSVRGEAVSNEAPIDPNKITYHETHEVDDNGVTTFHITGQNQNDSSVYELIGNVVGMKNGKIVAYASFAQEEVAAQDSFTANVKFLSTLNNKAEIVPMEYDELLMFTSMMSTDPS